MGQGAHAGSPGGLVTPHQGHPRTHPVHKLKVENAILHPNVRQPHPWPARVPCAATPNYTLIPPPRPRALCVGFGAPADMPQHRRKLPSVGP